MFELLTSPINSFIPAMDCNFQSCSYGSGSKHFRSPYLCRYPYLDMDRNPLGRFFGIVFVSEGWGNWSIHSKPRMLIGVKLLSCTSVNSSWRPHHRISNPDSGSLLEEDGMLSQVEEHDSSANSSKEDCTAKNGDSSELSCFSRKQVTLDETRFHYLEETNEDSLSKRILRLSRTNKVRSALELYKSMKLAALRPSSHACNSLLSCLLRNGMLDDAVRIFDFMRSDLMTSSHTYSLMLKAIADSKGFNAAVEMFRELEAGSNSKEDFDAVVYNTMMSVCGKANNWFLAHEIWRSMKISGHMGTALTYRLLICIFVRCGQNELAFEAYYDMVQQGLKPGDDSMHAIIGASAKEGKWDLALIVFRNMLNSGLKPNVIACNALINSLGKAGKVDLAFKTYSIMKSLGHSPDAYTWNSLLVALYRANQHADVLSLFEIIQKEQSSVLNFHLYNTTLMSCQKLGYWDRALQLLWQMESSGVSVSTATYNLVIGACEAARRPDVALQIYEHMLHHNDTPDTFTLMAMMRTCIWGSLWDEVEEILNKNRPSASLYNAAIQGLCLRGNTDLARKLYMKMRTNGLKPDGKTRALVLQKLPKYLTES